MKAPDGLEEYHIPVFLTEAVELLIFRRTGVYVDGTLGGGGHSLQLLQHLDADGRVFGFDQDPEAVDRAHQRFADEPRMTVVQSNVIHLSQVLHHHAVERIEGILLDLGMSSHQVDSPERGFSFQKDGPLDMRMDPSSARTASMILNEASARELARIFHDYGEERWSQRIAESVVRRRTKEPFRQTFDLVHAIRSVVKGPHVNKTLARIFQALRIAVNDELNVLSTALQSAFSLLSTGGRMVIISYHSLEDRIVKTFFKEEAAHCICPPHTPVCVCGKVQRARILTTRPVQPNEEEIRRNPRARSARLRAAEKIHE